MSETPSLVLVLPAYNEADRIGPALDELIGYLRRRGDTGRPGSRLGSRSSSSTTAAPTTQRASSNAGRMSSISPRP